MEKIVNIPYISLFILIVNNFYNYLIVRNLNIKRGLIFKILFVNLGIFFLFIFLFPNFLMLWTEPQQRFEYRIKMWLPLFVIVTFLFNGAICYPNLEAESKNKNLFSGLFSLIFLHTLACLFVLEEVVIRVDNVENNRLLLALVLIGIYFFNYLCWQKQNIFTTHLSASLFSTTFGLLSLFLMAYYIVKIDIYYNYDFIILPFLMLFTLFYSSDFIPTILYRILMFVNFGFVILALIIVATNINSDGNNEYFYNENHYEKRILDLEKSKYNMEYPPFMYYTAASICCDNRNALHIAHKLYENEKFPADFIQYDTLGTYFFNTIVKNNSRRAEIQALDIEYFNARLFYYIQNDSLVLKNKEILNK